jgi:hypothetical protein
MRTVILLGFVIVVVSCTSVSAYQLSIFPELSVSDYIWGTSGEPLFTDEIALTDKGYLRVVHDLRYSSYSRYWDDEGQEQKITVRGWGRENDVTYYRFASFTSVAYGLTEKIEISGRLPYIWRRLKIKDYVRVDGGGYIGYRDYANNNSSVGDLFFMLRMAPFTHGDRSPRFALGAGIKVPTGKSVDTLETGSKSVDFSFTAYGNYDFDMVDLYGYMGYVVAGKSNVGDFGDVMLYDLMITRPFLPQILGILELSGYYIAPSHIEGTSFREVSSYALSPRISISFPKQDLTLEGGLSFDVAGRNSLKGLYPVVRLYISRQLVKPPEPW